MTEHQEHPRRASDKHQHEWSQGDDIPSPPPNTGFRREPEWPRTAWAWMCFAAGVLAYVGYVLIIGFVWLVNQMHPAAAFIAATVIVFTLAMTLPFNAFSFVAAVMLAVALWLYRGN